MLLGACLMPSKILAGSPACPIFLFRINVTIANPETRKLLIINRHIAKMAPEEIARRSVYVLLKTACSSARSNGKSSAVKVH